MPGTLRYTPARLGVCRRVGVLTPLARAQFREMSGSGSLVTNPSHQTPSDMWQRKHIKSNFLTTFHGTVQ
ncbi:MAG: hypothetical protein ACFFCS_01755 [Candidatus Hodarchaeota archaeon]